MRALGPVLRRTEGSWVGWPGISDMDVEPFEFEGIEQRPVALSEAEIEGFYYGFCNGTLWPLYHDAVVAPEFHRHTWRPYVDVNRRYTEAAAAAMRPGDIAWIQDYQLQLVPSMLRASQPDATIGFYLHIPFPPIELFARLPWRKEIVEGLARIRRDCLPNAPKRRELWPCSSAVRRSRGSRETGSSLERPRNPLTACSDCHRSVRVRADGPLSRGSATRSRSAAGTR